MAKSILSDEHRCFMCGSYAFLERHHIFGGASRKVSEREGFTVYLCHFCHNEPPNGVHHNRRNMDWLRAKCQAKFEETHTREEFMRLIGRSYL